MNTTKTLRTSRRGFSSILAVIFVSLFAVIALSFTAMSNMNVQMAKNHNDIAKAHAAAESGIQVATYLTNQYRPTNDGTDQYGYFTSNKDISEDLARLTFQDFANRIIDQFAGTAILDGKGIYWDNDTLRIPDTGMIDLNNGTQGFVLTFSFEPASEFYNHHNMTVISVGTNGNVTRRIQIAYPIDRNGNVLEFAIASKGRMIATGDTTIDGNIYSTWPSPQYAAPFETTAETTINGTLNTILTWNELDYYNISLETLDENGEVVLDEDGYRVVSEEDKIQGYHEGINYDAAEVDTPGMDIEDYDTTSYRNQVTTIGAGDSTTIEYFPHEPGYYDHPKPGYSDYVISYYGMKMDRTVYENRSGNNALENVCIPAGSNALFKNCEFNGILYVECDGSGTSGFNNIRFEDCTFNGPIVTSTPTNFNWIRNTLYFTGTANFNNTAMEEATILGPHFNVNLGNTSEVEAGSGSTLTGAIVGGIVDVRGHAQIDGTIISMFDTRNYSSGYVTNIGFASDGGSESSALDPMDDVGVIHISPNPNRLLPSGIEAAVQFKPADGNTYVEL